MVSSRAAERFDALSTRTGDCRETGSLNYATTRNRTLAVGKRIEEEIRGEIDHPRVVPEPAETFPHCATARSPGNGMSPV
jgi:hypothetical protein